MGVARIAVAIDEAGRVSAHLGRCHAFRVFDVVDGTASAVEDRPNQHPGGEDHCHHGAGSLGSGVHNGAGVHGHAWLSQAVAGCGAVVAGCAGAGAVAGLAASGVSVFRGRVGMDATEAALLLAAGGLLPVAGTPAAAGAEQTVRVCAGGHGPHRRRGV